VFLEASAEAPIKATERGANKACASCFRASTLDTRSDVAIILLVMAEGTEGTKDVIIFLK
jgi:hypothetical protein